MSDAIPLLVPIGVQALLVNPLVQSHVVFERWNNVYDNLNSFQDPVPQAFVNLETGPPAAGVYLHWKLPAAITHGRSPQGGPIEFECIPNRWIVLRRAMQRDSVEAPQLTAWIIESDFLHPEQGSSAFADPSSTSGNVKPSRLGRNVPIAQYEGEPGTPMFLRPTGLADVTFAAYQPGVVDVLSFRDDPSSLAEGTLLTYLVAGWYSDPAADPLAKFSAQALGWTVLGAPSGPPDTTIVHGMIYGLEWQTTALPPRIDADASKMQVAVGYTAVDALSAIIAANAGASGSELETRLQAFQYDSLPLLDGPDGHAQLELRIRNAWFGSTPGGTRWRIAAVSQGQAEEPRPEGTNAPPPPPSPPLDRTAVPPAPPLTADQQKWLADLNVLQREYDATTRELRTMQWELFALWWKAKRVPLLDTAEFRDTFYIDPSALGREIEAALDPDAAEGVLARTIALQSQIASLAARLPDPTSARSVADFSSGMPLSPPPEPGTPAPPPLRLRPEALPAFFQPADPVVLIAGLEPPPNQPDDGSSLPCRTLDAVVTNVFAGVMHIDATTGSLPSIIATPDTSRLLPAIAPAIEALSVEAYFADPGNAAAIIRNGGGGSSKAGTAEDLARFIASGACLCATIEPALPAGFAFAAWQQAWSPLFLQWKISWFPTVSAKPQGPETPAPAAQYPPGSGGGVDNWPFLPDAWTFDGSDGVTARGSEYYRFTAASGTEVERSYIGRTFLTPQAGMLLIRRLEDYARLHPDDPEIAAIKSLIDAVGQTRFLSQALSGFNDAFVMRGQTHSSPPPADSPIAAAVGAENRGVPMVDVGDQDLSFDGGTPFFFPVRGGSFRFERLVIVDSFGQVLDLLAANGNASGGEANFSPIRGAGLLPDAGSGVADPQRRIEQAPRIVQPSRLDLLWLDADADDRQVDYSPGADPLCGWLLPNNLDRSIAAYDAAGNPLGELMVLADETGMATVRWLASPDLDNPIDDPGKIANRHLRGILSAFVGTGAIPEAERADAFRALYQSIDESLWTVDPPGGQADHDLAVLIGRPLAVVRAQVQFELYGRPAVNQSWRDTLQDLDAGLTGFSFPIRLGSCELLDDGFIGYFLGEDHVKFSAVHASAAATSPHVVPIGPGNYLSLPFDYPDYSRLNLTLLMDPLGKVHATTGLLPTATLRLPAEYYAAALKRLAVTFRTGPLLIQPAAVRLPYPAEHHGDWSWIRRTGTGADDWRFDAVVAADATARLPDTPPHLVEGWLKFAPKAKN